MIDAIREWLSYTFVSRSLIVGLLVALCAALLGVSLVLKRYSMIGDGLSHVGFGALSVAVACNWAPLAVSIPVVIVTAILLLQLNQRRHIHGDAAVAILSSSALAIGLIVTSLSGGTNVDVYQYLFGSILALSQQDVVISAALASVVLILFVALYPRLFAVTFDESFARATGVPVGWCNWLLAILTAVTVVVGMRLMGALLISSLLIFPALSAMRLCHRFRSVTLCAAGLSVLCFLVGMVASYQWSLPTGASVVAAHLVVFLLSVAVKACRSHRPGWSERH